MEKLLIALEKMFAKCMYTLSAPSIVLPLADTCRADVTTLVVLRKVDRAIAIAKTEVMILRKDSITRPSRKSGEVNVRLCCLMMNCAGATLDVVLSKRRGLSAPVLEVHR